MITTQLSTKFLNPDGTPASYDSGSRAILVPQLGRSPSRAREPTDQLTFAPGSDYLPPYRTYRVLIVPETRSSGFEFLLLFFMANPKKRIFPQGSTPAFVPQL